MNTRCNMTAIACDIIFKTVEGSAIVGVWWVNPANVQQILHVGQYHVHQDVWFDTVRGGLQIWADDAVCLKKRPAILLQVVDLVLIRKKAQALFAKTAVLAA